MEIVCVSLGGSIIVSDKIEHAFLKEFRELILRQIEKGRRFIIVCGGGATARDYIQGASKIEPDISHDDLDWLGIKATHINAQLVRTIFPKELAHRRIVLDPTKDKLDFHKKILVGAGWKPGFSTDYDAVLLAKRFKAKYMINLSNIEYVYDKDPRNHKDAKKLEKVKWSDFQKIVGDKWTPGLSMPFDPIATKEAAACNMAVAIMNGHDVKNFENFLEGKDFKGTLID